MRNMVEEILLSVNNPEKLESLYRKNPAEFKKAMSEPEIDNIESLLIEFWKTRLKNGPAGLKPEGSKENIWNAVLLIGLTILFGTLFKLIADHMQFIWDKKLEIFAGYSMFYCYFIPMIVFTALEHKTKISLIIKTTILQAASYLFIVLLIPNFTGNNDIKTIAVIHTSVVLFITLMAIFSTSFFNYEKRILFFEYVNEIIVNTAIVGILVSIVLGILNGLFALIHSNLFENLMLHGYPYIMIGTFGTSLLFSNKTKNLTSKIISAASRFIIPLLLIGVVIYIGSVIFTGQNPFQSGETLIVHNILTVFVLYLLIYSIIGQKQINRFENIYTIVIIIITSILDIIALSAMTYRLFAYGFSPNRIVTIIENIVVMVNIIGILYHLVRSGKNETGLEKLRLFISRYINVYFIWAVVIGFGFTVVYGLFVK